MRRRIFIAINLPEEIKEELAACQKKWPELPVRWTRKDSLHITLFFLGYLQDEELVEVCQLVKEVAERNNPFSISLNKIIYGPPKKIPPRSMSPSDSFLRSSSSSIKSMTPRMVWVEGERSEDFTALKQDLDRSLAGLRTPEKRAFSPHITLGRIRTFEWRQIEPEERPEVAEDINLTFEVNSIEVMESQLKKGGAEYTILESVQLARF